MKTRLKTLKSLVFIFIILLLAFRGWASSRDIEKRAFVLMQGVDSAPADSFTVTYNIAAPQALGKEEGDGGGKESMVIKKTRCKNLWQGHHSIQTQTEHPLFLGHVQTLVLGEDLARKGMGRVMDVFMRAAETRLKTWVVVAEGKADKVVEAAPKSEQIPALYISRALEMGDYLNILPLLRVAEFGIRLQSEGEEPIAPIVKADKDEITISGLALFRNDKMIGRLDHDEMHIFFLTAQGKGHTFKRFETENGDIFSYEIANVKRRVRLHRDGEQVSFVVELEVEGNIVEAETGRNLSSPEVLADIEKSLSTTLEKDCRAVLKKLQQDFKVDSYGFGAMVQGRYPDLWADMDWELEFPEVPIKIVVEASIRRVGMVAQ